MAAFYFRGNSLWVRGTIGGSTVKKPTGRKKTDLGFNTWYKKQTPERILTELVGGDSSKEEIRRMTFKEFGMKVLRDTAEDRGTDTQKDYVRILENNIEPAFKGLDIDQIDALKIADFLKKLRKTYSPDRARRIKNVLNLILESASDPSFAGVIDYNPMNSPLVKKIKFGKSAAKQKEYTTREVKAILDGAKGFLKPFLEIAFKHGLRVGEIIGLKWKDFDLEEGILYLQRSISKGVINEITEKNKNHLSNQIKKHNRGIVLFPGVVEVLKKWKEFCPSDEWVFPNPKTGRFFWDSREVVSLHFRPMLEELGIEYKTLRASRRAYASIFNYSVENKKELKERLGHSADSRVTDEHYIKEEVLEVDQRRQLAAQQEQLFDQLLQS